MLVDGAPRPRNEAQAWEVAWIHTVRLGCERYSNQEFLRTGNTKL
jgi:hypothetical protein